MQLKISMEAEQAREKRNQQSKISLDIKLRQGMRLTVTDTKFDSLNFVVEVGEPQKEGVMVKGRLFPFRLSVAAPESFGLRFTGR
jgi:hypothetical protein